MPRPVRPPVVPPTGGTGRTDTPATVRPGTTTPTAPTTPSSAPGRVADGFGGTSPAARAGRAVPLADGLFLSASGNFVSHAGQDKPITAAETGETLTRVAQLLEGGTNVFQSAGVTLAQKEAALTALTEAFNTGADPAKFGGNKDQALQTRASSAPLMLDLAQSLDPSKPAEKALLGKVFEQYQKALETEPHGQLRSFMLFDLDRAKGALPAEFRSTIDGLMREVAPLAPPYEEWFKNGNTNLKLEYYVGDGFWEEEVSAYTSRGFTKTENADGTVTLKKQMEKERQLNDGTVQKFVTDVELHMHNGPHGLFDKVNDPSVAGIVYSGHANYGREVPSHLAGAPELNGAKAFFSLQCGGKGTHNALLEKFPDLQVVSSKNSSYGYQDRATLLNTLEGVAARLPWSQISTQNARSNSDNYYFPTDTLIARRSTDGDRDGRADAWDRVLNVNPFHPQADIDKQLTATRPEKSIEQLDGKALSGAVFRFWRMAGYNQWAEHLKDQGVVGGGYYAGKPRDPLFKFDKVRGEDGREVVKVAVNQHYAHASEEVLGAALHYELGKQEAQKAGLSERDARAAGLLMAAKALDIDTSYNDEDAWKALLKFNGLPSNISYGDAMHANHEDEHYSAGGAATLETFKKSLSDKNISL
jgi:hypothetical protein